ncbi:hypothetical protein SAMN04489729_6935 [Amycolatopsis lurida]|nr:hypothetical protein SAMN04489729_6935 [Amycolatopsis lurida]
MERDCLSKSTDTAAAACSPTRLTTVAEPPESSAPAKPSSCCSSAAMFASSAPSRAFRTWARSPPGRSASTPQDGYRKGCRMRRQPKEDADRNQHDRPRGRAQGDLFRGQPGRRRGRDGDGSPAQERSDTQYTARRPPVGTTISGRSPVNRMIGDSSSRSSCFAAREADFLTTSTRGCGRSSGASASRSACSLRVSSSTSDAMPSWTRWASPTTTTADQVSRSG